MIIRQTQHERHHMKRALPILAAALATVAIGFATVADASGHALVVDGSNYDSTHEAGDSIHWETPGANPASASFAERSQTWAPGDNGSEHLPCEFGVHWVSNENVLTISGCLDDPNPTTTTVEDTTTIVADTTTTVAETTTTLADTTTTAAEPTTTVAATTTTAAAGPTTTVNPLTPRLPATGDSTLTLALLAAGCVLAGLALTRVLRPRR